MTPKKLRVIRMVSCSFFCSIGALSLIETLVTKPEYYQRDLIIWILLSLPFLISKRGFHLGFGVVAALVSIVLLLVYVSTNNPGRMAISLPFFLLGCLLLLLSLGAALALLYTATYTGEKNNFRLI